MRRRCSQELPADDRMKLDLARNLRTSGYLLEGISDRPAALAAYEQALAVVKGLKPAEGMTEPLYLVESRITHSIGWLYHANGKEEESVAWLRKACEILDQGIASRPAKTGSLVDKESRLFLVNTLNALSGPLGALRRTSESLADQRRALEVARAVSHDDPDDPANRNSVAATYYNIGGLYRSMARPDEAFSAFREGLDILDKLVNEYPAIIEYRRFQARNHNGCGDSLQEMGRPAEALAYFRLALETWKRVVDDNPDRYAEPVELGSTYNRIGWLLFARGRMTEALEQYEAARAVFQKLIDRFPPHLLPRTRSELSNVLINIAEIERRQGRLAEARTSCDKAIASREAVIKEFPEVLGYRIRMGECLLRSGQVRLDAGDIAGATADWRRAVASYEGLGYRVGEIALFEAGCHAMLSRAASLSGSGKSAGDEASEASKAIAILRKCIAEGYHDPELESESCLDPLRGRLDFRQLMMDVAFPAEPFEP